MCKFKNFLHVCVTLCTAIIHSRAHNSSDLYFLITSRRNHHSQLQEIIIAQMLPIGGESANQGRVTNLGPHGKHVEVVAVLSCICCSLTCVVGYGCCAMTAAHWLRTTSRAQWGCWLTLVTWPTSRDDGSIPTLAVNSSTRLSRQRYLATETIVLPVWLCVY